MDKVKIETQFTDDAELAVDLAIYGKLLQVPVESLAHKKQVIVNEYKNRKPLPTLEKQRYLVSRGVDCNFRVDYNESLKFEPGEVEVDLTQGMSSTELESVEFEQPLEVAENVKKLFRYENHVRKSDRLRILDEYNMQTGESYDFDYASNTRSVFHDELDSDRDVDPSDLVLSGVEIERLGSPSALDEAELESSYFENEEDDEDDEEDVEPKSNFVQNSFAFVPSGSSLEETLEAEQQNVPLNSLNGLDEQIEPLSEVSETDIETSSEVPTTEEEGSYDDLVFDTEIPKSKQHIVSGTRVELDDVSDVDLESGFLEDKSPEHCARVLSILPSVEDVLPELVEPKKEVKVSKERNVEQVIDRNMEPKDLREFLRKYPRCEYDFALKYFSKAQISKELKLGRIIKRGTMLKI